MLVAKPEYLFTCKLLALISRHELAMRDVYDTYFFAKNNWDLNQEIIAQRTGKKIKTCLTESIALIEKIKSNHILQGLGELLTEKEKNWVKTHLQTEVIFMLKNYFSIF